VDVEARGTECRFTTRADALGGPSKTLAIVSEGVSEAVQRSDSERTDEKAFGRFGAKTRK
jgi:hypothetical protein